MDGFPPGWEFQRGDILTSLETRSFEMTVDGKMRVREETVILEHPVRDISELLAHLNRWHATFAKVWDELRIAVEARLDDKAIDDWTAKLLDETRRELRNARRAVREWIDEPTKRPTFDDNPADIHEAERQLELLIDGLTSPTPIVPSSVLPDVAKGNVVMPPGAGVAQALEQLKMLTWDLHLDIYQFDETATKLSDEAEFSPGPAEDIQSMQWEWNYLGETADKIVRLGRAISRLIRENKSRSADESSWTHFR